MNMQLLLVLEPKVISNDLLSGNKMDNLKALYERLSCLSQFIESDLITYNGKSVDGLEDGLINPLSGCFVAPLYEKDKPVQLRLVWLAQKADNNSHEVVLKGEALEKFIRLMEVQSNSLKQH